MSMRKFALRDAGPLDAPMLAVLHAQAYREAPWTAKAIAEIIAMSGTYGVIAVTEPPDPGLSESPPEPVGFVLARSAADECEILALAVRPEDRRCGAGRALLRAVFPRARALAVKRIFLEVAEDNAAARCLYLQEGFSNVGRRPGYYRRGKDQRITAIVLARDFQAPDNQAPFS